MEISWMSLNLWHGRLYDQLKEFFKSYFPDILFVQELCQACSPADQIEHHHFADYLMKIGYVSMVYDPLKAIPDSGFRPDWGLAIFSKKWQISPSKLTFFQGAYDPDWDFPEDKDYRTSPTGVQSATILIDSVPINLFNVHGTWGFDGEESPQRQKLSSCLLSVTSGLNHVLIGGDFNMDYGIPSFKSIEAVYPCVFSSIPETTFNLQRKGDPGLGRRWMPVDMMFTSNDFQINQVEVLYQADVSDHLPLQAKISLK